MHGKSFRSQVLIAGLFLVILGLISFCPASCPDDGDRLPSSICLIVGGPFDGDRLSSSAVLPAGGPPYGDGLPSNLRISKS